MNLPARRLRHSLIDILVFPRGIRHRIVSSSPGAVTIPIVREREI